MEISSDIDSVINFLKKKKEEGYKSVELIDDARDYGWFYINPTLKFIYNKREPGVLGIDIRTKRLWNLTFLVIMWVANIGAALTKANEFKSRKSVIRLTEVRIGSSPIAHNTKNEWFTRKIGRGDINWVNKKGKF